MACTTASMDSKVDSVQGQQLLQQSKQLETVKELSAQGKIQQAITLLKGLIKEKKTSDAYFLLGNLYYQQKKYKNAYTNFMLVLPRSRHSTQAKVQAAYSLSHLGMNSKKKAYWMLEQILKTSRLPHKEKVRIYKLKSFLLQHVKHDPLEQIKTYVHLYHLSKNPTMKESYQSRGVSLIESNLLDEDQLQYIIQNKSLRILRAVAFFHLGSLYFQQGALQKASGYLKRTLKTKLDEQYKQKAKQILTQIESLSQVNPNTIGAILPLSGEDAVFGYKALRGLQLALGIYNAQTQKPSDMQLAVIDSRSDPLIAQKAVQRLVVEDHVIAIVGSLMSKTSDAVATHAQKLSVPNISLSQKNDITQIGNYVFQNALTGQMQIEFLVETAMHKKGLRRFAVLYPNDQYGVEYTQLFWNAVATKGGQVVAAQTYMKDETDFREQVQRMVGTFYIEDRKDEFKEKLKEWKDAHPNNRRGPPNNLLEPLVFFDALFIPDGIKVLGQVAPMLAYNGIEDMTLLGSNLWNTPLLSRRAGQFLKEPLFIDSFSMSDDAFVQSQFYKDYIQIFKQKPHILELQAFEAGLILRKAIQEGIKSRKELQQKMLHINLRGVLGDLKMTESRQVKRPMVALTYDSQSRQISTLFQN